MASKTISRPARTSPPVRNSYPTVFTPRAYRAGDEPKYMITMMFDKNNQEQMAFLKELHKDATEVLHEKWPDPATRPRIPLVGHTDSPIKDGDKTANRQGIPLVEKNPEYAGHFIIRATTKQRPVLADRNKQELLDSNEIYGGCFVKINLNAYSYDVGTNKGVTFGLNGVQKWSDGDSFGGNRPSLDDMFEAAGGSEDPLNYQNAGGDPFSGVGQPPQENVVPFGSGAATGTDDDIPF